MIGPTHYEGWTCIGCEHLKETTHFYCFAPAVLREVSDNRVENRQHTPSWCPYIRLAFMNHVMEVSDDRYHC